MELMLAKDLADSTISLAKGVLHNPQIHKKVGIQN
jgi:hypothetical protein